MYPLIFLYHKSDWQQLLLRSKVVYRFHLSSFLGLVLLKSASQVFG